MTPTNRSELIELMARERYEAFFAHSEMGWDQATVTGREIFRKEAVHALELLTAHGLAIVPVEATEDMCVAGTEQWLCEAAMEDRSAVNWAAMIEASPFKETVEYEPGSVR
jgi:hypothetical protein